MQIASHTQSKSIDPTPSETGREEQIQLRLLALESLVCLLSKYSYRLFGLHYEIKMIRVDLTQSSRNHRTTSAFFKKKKQKMDC